MPSKTKGKVHRAAGVLLTDARGRILLQLRDDDPRIPYPNHWGITGGNARPRERPENTARREVREETGIALDEFHPFRTYETETDDGKAYRTHFYYSTTSVAVDEMVVGEGQDLRFFDPQELHDLPIAFHHRDVLSDFVGSLEYQSCLSQPNEAIGRFLDALEDGADWFPALLEAIRSWELPEEVVRGRRYQYLIGGEAFDWLLLAERLCEEVDGAIPADEREMLLFFGRPPQELPVEEFKHAIGEAKHRAHLNYLYGVVIEEALQLTVEEEILKQCRSCVWDKPEGLQQRVFQHIYGRDHAELLQAFQGERGLPPGDELSYSALREFTYWLFKLRVGDSDPARVASDTRKALAQVSELEAAARRRAQRLAGPDVDATVVLDGEVVARER